MTNIKVQAHALQKGDVVGSGEKVLNVSTGIRTAKGKVEVTLEGSNKNGRYIRTAVWGRHTQINAHRVVDKDSQTV